MTPRARNSKLRSDRKDLLQRLEDKFTVGDGCWESTCALTRGYGTINHYGKMLKLHRVVYELLVGPIPAGMTLDHLCLNQRCVRPSHLEPVTMRENLHRAFVAGIHGGRVNKAKTHCPRGHPYDAANTKVHKDGRRDCRSCIRVNERARRQRLRASSD
jgi:hypothetical protein